jgi:hypothetical protein
MQLDGIEQMYLVPFCRQRQRVGAHAAPNVEHGRRRRRQVPRQDFARSGELKGEHCPESHALDPELVMGGYVGIQSGVIRHLLHVTRPRRLCCQRAGDR